MLSLPILMAAFSLSLNFAAHDLGQPAAKFLVEEAVNKRENNDSIFNDRENNPLTVSSAQLISIPITLQRNASWQSAFHTRSTKSDSGFLLLNDLTPDFLDIYGHPLNVLSSNSKVTDCTPHLLFDENFESGQWHRDWQTETAGDHSAQIVNAPDGSSGKVVRFELRKDDPDIASSRRAELLLPIDEPRVERWYGFRHFLPGDWQHDPSPEIITQWHAYPDFEKGETWRSPPLYIRVEGERMEIRLRWDSREVTPDNQPEGMATLWSDQFERSEWINWVFRVKWSAFDDGIIQVWRNGEMVVNHAGPNTYNDESGVYFKAGIYKPAWKYRPAESTTNQRVLYMDDFRFAGDEACYSDVAP